MGEMRRRYAPGGWARQAPGRTRLRPFRLGLAVVAVGLMAAAAGCGPTGSVSGLAGPTPSPSSSPVPFTLVIGPAAGSQNLPLSSEVEISLSGGQITDVTLIKAGTTTKLPGSMREDGTSWVPAGPLSPNTTYQVAVTATSVDGAQTATQTTSFSTMPDPGRETGTGLYLFNGETVGVAMPIVLEFNPPVPDSARAAVQKRLFVTSTPPQPGAWYWASGSQVW